MRWEKEKYGTIPEIVSAATAVVALIVAVYAAWVAWKAYGSAAEESKNKLSADALWEWGRRQPVNTRPCIELMLKFTANDWSSIVEREKFSLPGLKPEILKCLSDQDDAALATLFDKETGTLTAKGSYELASRLNAMLEADSFIAAFILKDVGNTQIFSRIGELICSDDKPIIEKLPDLPRIKDAFQSLRKYKDERCH